ncbi:hypothetical protein AB9F41_34310, partial [Rhizobium leguminosarum]
AQRPGALRDFLNLLGPDDDIARFEYLKKSARNFVSILIGIETKSPENFARLIDNLLRLAHRALERVIGGGKQIGADEIAHQYLVADLLFDAA